VNEIPIAALHESALGAKRTFSCASQCPLSEQERT
jgi:hypothetical protein